MPPFETPYNLRVLRGGRSTIRDIQPTGDKIKPVGSDVAVVPNDVKIDTSDPLTRAAMQLKLTATYDPVGALTGADNTGTVQDIIKQRVRRTYRNRYPET
jgi:hypothetical protein